MIPSAEARSPSVLREEASRSLAERAAFVVLVLVSLMAWGIFLFVMSRSVPDPLEVGGGEGLQMDHILRVAHLQPLYVAPSLRFIPLVYMPFYYVVVAPLVGWFGPHLWEGRLLSVLSTLGVALLMARIVTRETKNRAFGLAASAIYVMGEGFVKGHELVRPDSFMMVLALSGLYLLRARSGVGSAVVAGLLLSLAFFTKQNAACFGIAALAHLLVSDRKRLLPFAAVYVLCTTGGFWALSHWLGPWFSFYVFDVPRGWLHFSHGRVIEFVGHRLFVLGALTLSSLLAFALPESPWRGRQGLWVWVTLGGVGTALISTLDAYASHHVMMPTLVSVTLLGTISLAGLLRRIPAPVSGPDLRLATGYAVLVLQFVPLLYPVRSAYHREDTRRVHQRLVSKVLAYNSIMIPYHGFFAEQAGMQGSLCVLPLDDIIRGRRNRLMRSDSMFFDRMFEGLRHGPNRPALLTDLPLDSLGDVSRPYWASLVPHYRLVADFGSFADSLRPLLAGATSMKFVYVPVEEHPGTGPLGKAGRAKTEVPSSSMSAAAR